MPTALEPHITDTKRHRPRSIARLRWIPTELKYLIPRACPKRSEQGHMAGCQTETSLDWKHEEEWNLAVGPARREGTDDSMEAEKPRDPPAEPAAVRQHTQGPEAPERDAAQHSVVGTARLPSRVGTRLAQSRGSTRGSQGHKANVFRRTGQRRPSRTPPDRGRNHPPK